MSGTLKVDSINADSNLALKIANTAVAFIDSNGLRPTSGNVSLDATATSKLYLPSANTVAIQTAGVTAVTVDSSQNVTLAAALAVTGAATLSSSLGVTGVTTFAAGTAALPSITTAGDLNTGIFFPAADTIAFAEGGAEAMRIDSSGNVGIGTASPAEKLDVSGNIRLTGADTSIKFVNAGGYDFSIRGNTGNALEFYSPEFSANALMSLTNAGNFLVGTTTLPSSGGTTGFGVEVNASRGQISLRSSVTSSSFIQAFYNTNGLVGSIQTSGSATSFVTSSDYRLKEDIAPMTGALAKIALLKPSTYKWKVDGSDGEGFIAHELAEVVPQCVTGDKDAVREDGSIDPQGIDTSFLVATLTAAIQEQQAIITALTARIVALETI